MVVKMEKERRQSLLNYLFHREYSLSKRYSFSQANSFSVNENAHSFNRTNSATNKPQASHKSGMFNAMEVDVERLFESRAAWRGVIEKVCDLKGYTKSTFIIAFSSDGLRMASLHGDHSIRVIEIASGRNHQTLVGHPRSPWTAEFHKTHKDILASGCLSGQVRIWDLSSGECDMWQSAHQSTITSLALHPTEKILLIAESRNIHIWNWELSSQPQLFASSKKVFETVRWVKFNYDGDMFYTGRNASPEHNSWNILRQAPSLFEINQQRQRNEAAALRARNQYIASLNASVSLRDMLGNPLEISNDLLAQPGQADDSSMDVYHAATTFAQLHRIHTSESDTPNNSNETQTISSRQDESTSPTSSSRDQEGDASDTTRGYASPRQNTSLLEQPTATQAEEIPLIPDVLTTSQPSFNPDQELDLDFIISRESMSLRRSMEAGSIPSARSQEHSRTQSASRAHARTQSVSGAHATTQSGSGAHARDSDISERSTSRSANTPDDSIFGVSLSRRLTNSQPVNVSSARARNLAISRPPSSSIRINPVVVNMYEPTQEGRQPAPEEGADNAAPSGAVDGAAGREIGNTDMGCWNEVMVPLARLEGRRGPRRYSSTVSDIISRLNALPEVSDQHQQYSNDVNRLRWLQQLVVNIQCCLRRSAHDTDGPDQASRLRLINIVQAINTNCSQNHVESSSRATPRETDTVPSVTYTQDNSISSTSTQHTYYTDSSTNTVRPSTRSFGVSTEEVSADPIIRQHRSHQHRTHTHSRSAAVSEGERTQRDVRDPLIHHNWDLPYPNVRRQPLHTARTPQQIQRWRLDDQVTNLNNENNVIIRRCKIHNDAGIDISQDGTILALFVVNPNIARCPGIHSGLLPDTMLRLISLKEDSLGDVLHQLTLVGNPVSLSISPLNGYIMIGLTGLGSHTDHPMIKYDIYKIPSEPGLLLKLSRSVYTMREDSPQATVNSVRWLPRSGQGIVIATNRGHVIVNHNTCASTSTLNLDSNSRGSYL